MKKIFFRLIIGLLVFLITSPIFLNVLGLEFSNEKFEYSFDSIRFWGIFICILLISFGSMKRTNTVGEILLKLITTIGVIFLTYFFMVLTVFTGMCAWSDKEIIYINKNDKNVKIIKRDYGCGAWDSDPPDEKIFRVKTISKYFIYVNEIDIDDIEKSEWLVVE